MKKRPDNYQFSGWRITFATPADWQPEEDVIIPITGSCGVAKECMAYKVNMKCYDWFFCTKPLDKQTILKTVLKK